MPADALAVSKFLAAEGVDALDVSLIANSSWKVNRNLPGFRPSA